MWVCEPILHPSQNFHFRVIILITIISTCLIAYHVFQLAFYMHFQVYFSKFFYVLSISLSILHSKKLKSNNMSLAQITCRNDGVVKCNQFSLISEPVLHPTALICLSSFPFLVANKIPVQCSSLPLTVVLTQCLDRLDSRT